MLHPFREQHLHPYNINRRNNCKKTHTCFIRFNNGYWQIHGRQIQGNTHEKRCETTREKKKALNNSHIVTSHGVLGSETLCPLNSLLKKQEAYFSIWGIFYTPKTRDSDCFTHNDIISHHVPLGWSCTAGPNQHRNFGQPSFTAAPSERRERTDEVRESP